MEDEDGKFERLAYTYARTPLIIQQILPTYTYRYLCLEGKPLLPR